MATYSKNHKHGGSGLLNIRMPMIDTPNKSEWIISETPLMKNLFCNKLNSRYAISPIVD